MRGQQVYAYAGKILRVDLTAGIISTEPTVKYAREWLGGPGIGVWILYKEVKPRITPFSPANRLILGAGALVGTLAPGASRISADSKNAKTLGIGTSNSDSHFGPALKFAGYDSIVLQGKARKPVYLWIDDEHVEIRDAAHLWGKTTWETVDLIRDELGDDQNIQIVSIGPAGENIVRAACIIQGKGRAMGRCGTGSVMGSKNLKAVAVRGSGSITIADPDRFMNAVDEARKLSEQCPISAKFIQFGTPGLITPIQEAGAIPYKNFQNFQFPEESFNKLRTDIEKRKYMVRNLGYMGCPAPCGHSYAIDQGPYAGLKTEGFQFEALSDFAARLGVDDIDFVIMANAYANQLGLDIDNTAIPITWATECFQRGFLGKDDLDGLELEWGNTEVILELMRKIAWREGVGDVLGEGCAHAAEVFGKGEYYAQNIKGQDLFETCRGEVGWALGVCTATRGGAHTTGAPFCEKSFEFNQELAKRVYEIPTSVNVVDYEGKAHLVSFYEKLTRVDNCLGICLLDTASENPALPSFPEIAELYSAATGWETSVDNLKRAATRILNVEKAFNLLHTSFDRKDDYPTQRDLEEPIPGGPKKGWKLDRARWDRMLDEYYEMHNWDKKTGFPTRKCLEDLGLNEIADDLEKAGKLGGVDI